MSRGLKLQHLEKGAVICTDKRDITWNLTSLMSGMFKNSFFKKFCIAYIELENSLLLFVFLQVKNESQSYGDYF